MSDDKFKDLTRMNARHLIKIRIEEEVRTKFPDVGGAFADIHHTRKISGNPEDTKLTANVSIADTLNVGIIPQVIGIARRFQLQCIFDEAAPAQRRGEQIPVCLYRPSLGFQPGGDSAQTEVEIGILLGHVPAVTG